MFLVKLECDSGNPTQVYIHQQALIVATTIYNCYIQAQEIGLPGIGPEVYVEQWICSFLVNLDHEFEDLIMMYFIQIIHGIQTNDAT